MNVPTGNDGETVSQYYDYLYNHYLSQITQQFRISWVSIAWVVFYIGILAGGLLIATRWQRGTRAAVEPYPVETYDGYISEGNGPVGAFLLVFFAAMALWALAITIIHLQQGQIY